MKTINSFVVLALINNVSAVRMQHDSDVYGANGIDYQNNNAQ